MTGAEVVLIAVGISAVIGAGYSIHRVAKSIRAWARRMIAIAGHEFSQAVDASSTGHIVKHHLGPNGTTKPMHVVVAENHDTELEHHRQNTQKLDAVIERLGAVEEAQRIAASTAVTVAGVEAERHQRDDPPKFSPQVQRRRDFREQQRNQPEGDTE